MEELTIEEKAKAYDFSLKRAKRLYEQGTITESLSYVFPQLKKLGDGEVRKEIIQLIQGMHDADPRKERWLAWLEKQESYYTFEIKEGHWYKCVCDYMLNGSDLMFKNDRLYYCRRNWRLRGEIDERNVKDIGINGYKSFFRPATNQEIKDWLEKQGEPTDINPSEFDLHLNKLLKQFETLPKEELASSLSFYLNVVQNDGTYREEKQGEQKPQRMISAEAKEAMYGKPAWSEEDEKMIRGFIAICDEWVVRHSCYPVENCDIEKLKNWLKSLKDRVGCETDCTTMWKPSEKQLNILNEVIDVLDRLKLFGGKNVLMGLKHDLKKLMEK